MPLVTLTASNLYYPEPDYGFGSHPRKDIVVSFAIHIPDVIAKIASQLHINADSTDVLVDIKQFHQFSVNTPDIGILIAFSEEMGEDQRLEARDALLGAIQDLFHIYGGGNIHNWALDLFWGPSHGYYCITDEVGTVHTQDW